VHRQILPAPTAAASSTIAGRIMARAGRAAELAVQLPISTETMRSEASAVWSIASWLSTVGTTVCRSASQ